MSDCVGSWRRTLLVNLDGSRDTTTDVRWLQGITAFVDSRGFGGWLNQRADVFEWSHFVNVQASEAHPDAAVMRWDDNTLIETGVYTDYIEHWDRDLSAAASPCWALTLCSAEGNDALLLRVGNLFGWVRRDTRAEVSIPGFITDVVPTQEGISYTVVVKAGDKIRKGALDGTVKLWDVQSRACLRTLSAERWYEQLDITGLTGVTSAQRASLLALGAVNHLG